MERERAFRLIAFARDGGGRVQRVYTPAHDVVELENRIPETAPYDISEAQFFPPPYEEYWKGTANPGQCQSCHRRIFEDWAGSMMANAWRDPAWRGAFLLAARQLSTDGDCERAAAAGRHRQGAAEPVRLAGGMRVDVRYRQGHATGCRARDRSSTASARAATCRATTSTTCRSTTSPPIARPAWSTRGWPRISIPRRTPAPGSRSRRTSASSATPSRGRRASSAPSATASPRTRDTPYHTLARAGSPREPEYVPARGTASRAQLVPERQDIFDVPDRERATTSGTPSAPAAFASRRTPSVSPIGSDRSPPRAHAPRTHTSRVCSERRCRTSRWTRASTTAITTCS